MGLGGEKEGMGGNGRYRRGVKAHTCSLTPKSKMLDSPLNVMADWTQARQRGILNEAADCFMSTATGKQMSLDEAVNAGLVTAEFDEVAGQTATEPTYETTTYAIGFVLDQVNNGGARNFQLGARRSGGQ